MTSRHRKRDDRSRTFRDCSPRETIDVDQAVAMPVNRKIRQYFQNRRQLKTDLSWINLPELPTSKEILDIEDGDDEGPQEPVSLVTNRPKGAWESKAEYLKVMYELQREDAICSLREAVVRMRHHPLAIEAEHDGQIGIYDKVHVNQVVFSTRGLAIRVSFGLARVQRQVPWEHSKRLMTGRLVVLSPVADSFQEKAIVAVVAGRSLRDLNENPPKVDLFVARDEDVPLDPAEEFLMIEVKTGLFEASRHTLLALQHHMQEDSLFDRHFVDVQPHVDPPLYVQSHPVVDLSCLMSDENAPKSYTVDILKEWPRGSLAGLDDSQSVALRQIVSKQLAIVQKFAKNITDRHKGPPGTGKTHVSVLALKVLIANRLPGDPPIVIAAHTNHALDQILLHVAVFEPNFIRLGGRSKDQDVIKARTLYELRNSEPLLPPRGSLFGAGRRALSNLEKEITKLLGPLGKTGEPLDPDALQTYGVLTASQVHSLRIGATQWTYCDNNQIRALQNPFFIWLSSKSLLPVSPQHQSDFSMFDFEEADLEPDLLPEAENDEQMKETDDLDALTGNRFTLFDNYTCRTTAGQRKIQIDTLLCEQDMWKIPESARPAIYLSLQTKLKVLIAAAFRKKALEWRKATQDIKIGRFERDEQYLRKQAVIGMTTTGLSKYRGHVAAMGVKIILMEEAGEILEPPVLVACTPSVQHLILVGDHKQLRPQCQTKRYENHPYFFNKSLFERMMENGVESATLATQRRMLPEIRMLLKPIYGDLLQDHASVLTRPPIPGMNGVNTYFFAHDWPERRDEHMSVFNADEADMVVGLFQHLIYNGLQFDEITVLTFYNGQRKQILRRLRACPGWSKQAFIVVTVDSYQGEENRVVILSLVRSNATAQIGFLAVKNRVCVALSRAQCGFYMFGNGKILYKNKTWKEVIKLMNEKLLNGRQRLSSNLPLFCQKHKHHITIENPSDWSGLSGGCREGCAATLPCGHQCKLQCHPFNHALITCSEPCKRHLPCGHGSCKRMCGEVCECKICKGGPPKVKSSARRPDQIIDLDVLMFKQAQNMHATCIEVNNEVWKGSLSYRPSLDKHMATNRADLLIDFDDGAQASSVGTQSEISTVLDGVSLIDLS